MSKKDYKEYEGVSLKKVMLENWTDAHFLNWIRLVHFFTDKTEKKLRFTELSLKAFREACRENEMWKEWMYRIEANKLDYDIGTISGRFLNSNRLIGSYLQGNPHKVTNQMRGIMEINIYLKKYIEPFTTKTSAIGADIVTTNSDDLARFELPEVQYHKAMLKMSKVADELLDKISRTDIKKMSPKDRISLANTLLGTLSRVQGGHKPNMQIFKQLVINQAGRQDLESAMLEYTQDQI